MAEASDEVTIHHSVEEHSKLFRDLLLGFVKVHVLYHASQEPIYGAGITSELDRHGYHLSPGTLYPLLHSLEAARFVEREDRVVGGKVRKYYRTTTLGRRAFAEARRKVVELVDEISAADLSDVEDDLGLADGAGRKANANAKAGAKSKGR
jgi:PadR family transcriptional regulator PadR